MKKIIFICLEVFFFPLTIFTAIWIKILTKGGLENTLISEKIFMFFRVLPLRDHYYQPLINPKKHLYKPLYMDRELPGINFNCKTQIKLLEEFSYNKELLELPIYKPNNSSLNFYYNNGSFESGDAEYLYNIIRHFKPNKMIEIGSGFSTLISIEAFKKNMLSAKSYKYEHICIEPFEQPWLEKTSAKIIRKKVESIDVEMFRLLQENDILFIDSSHIIRPQGDVLFEILEILPILNSGVLIHFHDIFTPKDYLENWIIKEHKLWNEQYLLEAFLTNNHEFEVIGSLNYLFHNYNEKLCLKSPILKIQKNREPGSFWIRKK